MDWKSEVKVEKYPLMVEIGSFCGHFAMESVPDPFPSSNSGGFFYIVACHLSKGSYFRWREDEWRAYQCGPPTMRHKFFFNYR